ncbi:MAG: hypothetical protein ACRDV8_05695 [Acidimicrobiales bacterium]
MASPSAAAPAHLAPRLLATRVAREVSKLVGDLGATRGEVAHALEKAGVRAAPGDPARSPVGLYLGAVVGADPSVTTVAIEGASVVVELRARVRAVVTVPLPAVVHDFTVAFDARCYPALLSADRPGRAAQTSGQG